jgi:putative type II/III system pilus formation protein
MVWRDATLVSVSFALIMGSVAAAEAEGRPATLTVVVTGVTTRTVLHLQPGFATVLRADRRIETVAVGDPRLVSATVVKRGQDAHDLVLQPQAETGATNMVVWFGGQTTIWELMIGPGLRTADIVYIVTAPARSTRPSDTPSAGPPTLSSRGHSEEQLRASPAAAGTDEASPPPSLLEVRQTVGEVSAVFQALRARDGVFIRYRVTNSSGTDLTLHPGSVLVRANGRIVPYGMARNNVDRARPEIIPRGATESGIIQTPARTPQRIQLIVSLFPVAEDMHALGTGLPFIFQPVFIGIDRLVVSPDL